MTEVIKEIAGVKTCLFAPPYGDLTIPPSRRLIHWDIKPLCDIDTIDWRRDGVENIVKRVIKNPHNGAFILMHPTEDTIKALPVIIDNLREKGFEIGCISDLISNGDQTDN